MNMKLNGVMMGAPMTLIFALPQTSVTGQDDYTPKTLTPCQ
ncbi:hypothetical protein [Vibrio hangzhouensis]|nr:hypothetical protein [Vibrio hangzhouensis]